MTLPAMMRSSHVDVRYKQAHGLLHLISRDTLTIILPVAETTLLLIESEIFSNVEASLIT